MSGVEIKIQSLGNTIQDIGYKVMPFSFLTYFITRHLEYRWNSISYSKLAKTIWYIAIGIGTIEGDMRIERLVTMMIFFDAFDSYMEYKEEKRRINSKR